MRRWVPTASAVRAGEVDCHSVRSAAASPHTKPRCEREIGRHRQRPTCRYVRGPLPGMPYSVRCYGVSWIGITSGTRMAGCLPSVMPAGGELGETGTLDFSGVRRCSR